MSDPEVHRALGRIEGKLDGLAQRLDGSDARVGSAEKRIAALETRMNYFLGIAAALGAFVPLLLRKLFGVAL
jgi:hypothetical protein